MAEHVDEVVVLRLTRGRAVPEATVAERRAAFARLAVIGVPIREIARRIGVPERTLQRWAAREDARRSSRSRTTPS